MKTATMTTVYRVRSHMKNDTPDGREVVFSGTPSECDKFYNDLTHAQRVSNRYLFADEGVDAVDYLDWTHAGCNA